MTSSSNSSSSSGAEQEKKREYLNRIYTDPSHAASYSGPQRLKREIDREGKFKVDRKEILSFLESKDTYSINRPIHRRHKRNRIVVSGIRQQYDMDLCDMSRLRRYRGNRGTRYLLTVIDVFSRFAFVMPLRDKSGTSVAQALEVVLTGDLKPQRFRSDRGAEFKSKAVTDLLRRKGVKQYFTSTDLKCQPVERFNQTLKNSVYKWCYENRSFAYVPVLDQIVDGYNHRVHSSLFGLSPSEVNETNQVGLWNKMYAGSADPRPDVRVPRARSFKYNEGDLVRISLAKRTFERSYSQKFTEQIFKIRGRYLRENVPVYLLMDLEEEPIESTFYEPELQRVQKNLNDTLEWEIERVLKRRNVGSRQEVLVRYRGLGPKFDRWIPRSSVGNNNNKKNNNNINTD
jgi:transposase InsO family protein